MTCHGIFGQRDNDVELACLTEMSPIEIFLFQDRVNVRIKEFEDWLDSQPEERIIVVGHSRYFKVMLDAEEVMDNCSILECTFYPRSLPDEMQSGESEGNTDSIVTKEDTHGQIRHDEQGEGKNSSTPERTSSPSGSRCRWKVERILYTIQDINESKQKEKQQDI